MMLPALSDASLHALLEEDTPHGDLTTETLGLGDRPGVMTFVPRDSLTLCGVEEAARLIALSGAVPEIHHPSGTPLDAGVLVLRATGSAAALHRAWKPAQTLMEQTSGIATAARALVAAAQAADPRAVVATTRKTFPGTRALMAKAVKAGGASLHRLGLSETLLVFAEHRAFLTPEELETHLLVLRDRCPEKRVVTEVTTQAEAHMAIVGGADVIQLERFTPSQVDALTHFLDARGLRGRVTLAAAGGVTVANAAQYVAAGARLLVTSAPYLAPPRDIKVVLRPA